jgi:ADP-ribose diphosphatase
VTDPEALPEVTATELLMRAPVFDVVRSTIRFADGHEADRTVVEHPGAVAIIALDGSDRWLLVRQYRPPARKQLLEIPAGTLEPGEEPAVTAARELREETGFAAASIERIGGAWSAPGFCDEYMHFFVARSLRPDPLPQDEDEHISDPIAMSLDDVLAAIDDGAIEDAKTIVAVTLWQRFLSRTAGAPRA